MIKFQTWIENKIKEGKLEEIPDILKQMFHNNSSEKPDETPVLPMFLKRDKPEHTKTTRPTRKPGSAPLKNRVQNRGKND